MSTKTPPASPTQSTPPPTRTKAKHSPTNSAATTQPLLTFDTNTRALSFKQSPNYEQPTDQNTDNVYQITITAADSQYSTSQAIAIAVADLNDEAPQFTSATSLALDFTSVFVGAIVYTAQATDADLGDQITYALSGADASHFSFDSSSGALAFSELPSLENPKDANTDNVYQLSITATDLGATIAPTLL